MERAIARYPDPLPPYQAVTATAIRKSAMSRSKSLRKSANPSANATERTARPYLAAVRAEVGDEGS
jgi:hypothetical protein